MQQASEVAIVGLHCGGEGLWWTLWHVAAAMDGPGVLWWPLWHVAAAIGVVVLWWGLVRPISLHLGGSVTPV